MTHAVAQLVERITPMTPSMHWQGRAAVIKVLGDVDLLSAPRLQETVAGALKDGPPVVVIDLRAVTYFGCSGLATLLRVQNRIDNRTRLRIVAGGSVLRQLRRFGVDRWIILCDALDDALSCPFLAAGRLVT